MEPYKITDDLKRFDRRNTAFARAQSDGTSVAHGKRARSAEEMIASGKAGFGREDLALHAAARTADRVLQQSWHNADQTPAGERHAPDDWPAFTARVKRAAEFYGASLAGVARVNPLWLYALADGQADDVLPAGMDTAIVIAIEMDYDGIAQSPTVLAAAAAGMGYSRAALTATALAQYLRQLGWRAMPSGNDTALSVPLAIDAGLGELGRNGMLITERFGPRVRLCKVFTDAPLTCDEPVSFGAADRCDGCTCCADACPAGAITTGEPTAEGPTPASNPGAIKWQVNADKCLAFWRVNGASCCNCIKACPFNQPGG